MVDLLQERPAARKHGRGMVISVPLPGAHWCIWVLESVPALAGIGPMLARAQAISGGLAGYGASQARPVAQKGPELAALALALKAPVRRAESVVQFLGERLVEAGEGSGLAIFTLKGERVAKIWASDSGIAAASDLIRNLLPRAIGVADNNPLHFDLGTDAQGALEAGLILERLGRKSLTLLPPAQPGGYGAVLFDTESADQGMAPAIPALMQLIHPLRLQAKSARWRWMKPLGWAAAALLALFLAWPVPERITLTGVATPEHSVIAALSSDAVLEEMLVRVGDQVGEGQPMARFRSTTLSEQAAQERLNISVEELNAQAAMAKNDYGAVRLHESRRQIAEARLAEVQRRIDQLVILAPAAGRVISALPPHATGGSFTTGREVAQIQTGSDFVMVLTPSTGDARRLTTGMKGSAMFRGLSDAEYRVTVISPPALVRNSQTGTDHLELIARIDPGDDRLLAGLTGYARLEGETTPRILGLTHYLTEYARTTLWTYLGLRL
ncbi:hypothetical protein [Gemmobacter sp. 24YEA27]|uniref:efflux RND transporter periplasmic adaptor subunit n=1 Tax=Gemmobacter sp. 24YEA27 TaxID=3040672 RepID=UPI0024B3AF82|nr:hypothetical protein [Gemmobacter sp. 24YEA27]